MISWDPRNIPDYIEIGHNCIVSKYKNNGYGKIQLQEAYRRIVLNDVNRIIVTTNVGLFPAEPDTFKMKINKSQGQYIKIFPEYNIKH